MKFEQIMSDIKARNFSPVYFLHGEEPYFIDLISDKLLETVLKEEEKSFNQTVLYGLDSNVETVAAEAKKFPMMAEYNLVVVKEAQHLDKLELLENYFSNPPKTTVLVFCYKKKADGRKAIFKKLAKTGVYFESKPLYDNQVPDWISKELEKEGFHISAHNAALMTEALGNDLGNISNEISKFVLNLPKGATISGEEIETYIGISKDYNTFELNNALGQRNIVKAQRIVQHFAQNSKKYAMPFVVSVVYGYFSKALKFHYAQGKPRNQQAQFIGVNPFFLKDYERAIKNYSKNKIVEIIEILKIYDLKSKGMGNASTDDGELMKEMVYRIMN